ncbi:MAG: hypothetical protein KBD62_36025 [Kofleriaceae bacterium]|nr:hypothetical protein [Kofleriaceae bacterium]
MSDDFPMPCVECLLHHPYKHAEPWTCPACGLIHAVVMPGVRLAKFGAVEKRPRYMTPEREDAIEFALCAADCRIIDRGNAWTWGERPDYQRDAELALFSTARVADRPLIGGMGWLEAAALLRDGWNPGDPVVRK